MHAASLNGYSGDLAGLIKMPPGSYSWKAVKVATDGGALNVRSSPGGQITGKVANGAFVRGYWINVPSKGDVGASPRKGFLFIEIPPGPGEYWMMYAPGKEPPKDAWQADGSSGARAGWVSENYLTDVPASVGSTYGGSGSLTTAPKGGSGGGGSGGGAGLAMEVFNKHPEFSKSLANHKALRDALRPPQKAAIPWWLIVGGVAFAAGAGPAIAAVSAAATYYATKTT